MPQFQVSRPDAGDVQDAADGDAAPDHDNLPFSPAMAVARMVSWSAGGSYTMIAHRLVSAQDGPSSRAADVSWGLSSHVVTQAKGTRYKAVGVPIVIGPLTQPKALRNQSTLLHLVSVSRGGSHEQ